MGMIKNKNFHWSWRNCHLVTLGFFSSNHLMSKKFFKVAGIEPRSSGAAGNYSIHYTPELAVKAL